jgi:hypothetical protein
VVWAVFQLTGGESPAPLNAVSEWMAATSFFCDSALPTYLRPATKSEAEIQPSMATSS